MTDLLVIGGGAAGLMAAGAACARGLTVTVLEHNPKGPGQKLLITGKGRCNLTSDSDVREFLPYVRRNGRFLYSSLYAFPPSAAMELFESLGVPLKTERGRRVFPQSDRAADVLAALRDYARDAEFVRGSAKKLLTEDGACKGAVTDRGETYRAAHTLIATGGISYPVTGSDGSGYKLEAEVEQKIEDYIDGKTEEIPFATRENIGRTVDFSAGRNRYIGYLISLPTRSFKTMRVGLDCSNGSASSIAKSVFDALGAKTYVINNEPDGTNINRDCGSTHIEGLQEFVKEKGLDNNLLELIAADPAFNMTLEQLESCMEPSRYVGRSEIQVTNFLRDVVQPILDANKDVLGVKAEITV